MDQFVGVDLQDLQYRCALAEAKCKVYELERERTRTAIELRLSRGGGDDRRNRQATVDFVAEKLAVARGELEELEKRGLAESVRRRR